MSDPVAAPSVTFVIEGEVNVQITITELGDGTLKFEAKVLDDTGAIGDLRGLFFDVADEIPAVGSSDQRRRRDEDADF